MHSESERGVEVADPTLLDGVLVMLGAFSHRAWAKPEVEAVAPAKAAVDRATNPTTGWRSDMENAPRDGTWFLMYAPNAEPNVLIGWWDNEEYDRDAVWGWFGMEADGMRSHIVPVAWQPLPLPPTTPPAGGEHVE